MFAAASSDDRAASKRQSRAASLRPIRISAMPRNARSIADFGHFTSASRSM